MNTTVNTEACVFYKSVCFGSSKTHGDDPCSVCVTVHPEVFKAEYPDTFDEELDQTKAREEQDVVLLAFYEQIENRLVQDKPYACATRSSNHEIIKYVARIRGGSEGIHTNKDYSCKAVERSDQLCERCYDAVIELQKYDPEILKGQFDNNRIWLFPSSS